jgi:hypothetical protein
MRWDGHVAGTWVEKFVHKNYFIKKKQGGKGCFKINPKIRKYVVSVWDLFRFLSAGFNVGLL